MTFNTQLLVVTFLHADMQWLSLPPSCRLWMDGRLDTINPTPVTNITAIAEKKEHDEASSNEEGEINSLLSS